MTKRERIIEWMRYKAKRCGVPQYFPPEIENDILGWDDGKVYRVFYELVQMNRFVDGIMFNAIKCPYCIYNIYECTECFYGKINGICDDQGSVWKRNELGLIISTQEDVEFYNKLFKDETS